MDTKTDTLAGIDGVDAPADCELGKSTPTPDRIHILRGELLVIAESLDGSCQFLLEDAVDLPQEIKQNADEMHAAVRRLFAYIKEQLAPDEFDFNELSLEERLAAIRHEVGNQLNQVQGYCQLFRMDVEGTLIGALSEDLAKIEQLCVDATKILNRHKHHKEDSHDVIQSSWVSSKPFDLLHKPTSLSVEPAKILVVDDSPNSRDILVHFLKKQGHSVGIACNGIQALEVLKKGEFDLVLLDCVMPEMDGISMLKTLKSDIRLKHIPVIIVSALDKVQQAVQCIDIGAEDFLTKPVDLALLRARTASSLERKRLREREYAQFFTPQLARHFARNPELLLETHEPKVTLLFCDIRSFSSISEKLGPGDTLNWLRDVMEVLSECVIEHRGVLVDYIGDELMAMFGAPEEQEMQADLACRTAIEMLARMPELNRKWRPVVGQDTRIGIGVNSGLARVGNTGTQRKFKYGPLGSSVNLASRVQGATKFLKVDFLTTGNTLSEFQGDFLKRRLCTVKVVNIEKPVELYEVRADQSESFDCLSEQYQEALANFESQQFTEAASILGTLLRDFPDDGPSLLLISRVVEALLQKPDHFDPVWTLPGK